MKWNCTYENDKSYLVGWLFAFTLADRRSEPWLGTNLNVEREGVRTLFNMFFSHAVKVFLNLATETVVQLNQLHALHEFVQFVLGRGHISVEIVANLKDHDERRKSIQNMLEAESTIPRVFACKKNCGTIKLSKKF